MASYDQTEFLNTTYYFFDFLCGGLVIDVRDSLMFSEDNIDEKFRHAVQALKTKNLSPDEYDHDLEQITLRFKISLPTTARYSALVSLITGVAWSAEYLNAHLKDPRGRRTDADFGLHRLQYLNEKTSLGRDTTLQNYRNLVAVRNCIVHNAGIQRNTSRSRSAVPLPSAISALPGFSLSDDLFVWFGKRKFVAIERGALEPHITEMAELLIALNKAADDARLLKYD